MPTSKPTSTAERAAAALREQQRQERMRSFAMIGGVVLVLAIIGGLAWFAISRDDTTGAAVGAAGTPANTDGYAVVVGQADAPVTLKFYEDPQCPICQQFEATVGSKVAAGIAAGKVKVEYHVVSFLDRSSKNAYSSRAANALYVVADTAGPEAFQKMHDILYQNQPAEGTAGPENDQLVTWAVEAGAKESAVSGPIDDGQYDQFVQNATDQMSKDGVNGTPGIFIDGKFQTDLNAGVQAVLAAVE